MFKSIKAAYYRTKYIEKMSPVYNITEMPDEKTDELIDYIDDEILIMDRTPTKLESTICIVALLVPLGIFLEGVITTIIDFDTKANVIDRIFIILFLVAVVVILIILLYYIAFYLYRGKRVITFHRLTGMVELPRRWFKGWNGATITFPFSDQCITWVSGFGGAQYKLVYPNERGSIYLLPNYMRKKFSFILWFMDRNRQLPPSKRLDPYRVKDFLRRESEGFPAPLRCANIRIPSHKTVPPELRKERKQEQYESN